MIHHFPFALSSSVLWARELGEGRRRKKEIRIVNGISFCMFTQKKTPVIELSPKPIEVYEKNMASFRRVLLKHSSWNFGLDLLLLGFGLTEFF